MKTKYDSNGLPPARTIDQLIDFISTTNDVTKSTETKQTAATYGHSSKKKQQLGSSKYQIPLGYKRSNQTNGSLKSTELTIDRELTANFLHQNRICGSRFTSITIFEFIHTNYQILKLY